MLLFSTTIVVVSLFCVFHRFFLVKNFAFRRNFFLFSIFFTKFDVNLSSHALDKTNCLFCVVLKFDIFMNSRCKKFYARYIFSSK